MSNLFLMAYQCLIESSFEKKTELSIEHAGKILGHQVQIMPTEDISVDFCVGRPDKPVLISPKDLPRRNITTSEGRAAMIHSFAHIEFNAINLAWDLIYRFQHMPEEFYYDWTKIALEETTHFNLLRQALNDLGYDYGDFPAHNGLWEIAEKTSQDILLRLAVVPRIMEARGLDVTPDLIKRFHDIKDDKTVAILKTILNDEIGHVSIGSKWYHYLCDKNGLDAELTFRKIADEYIPSNKNKKLNREARLQAGFSETELDYILSV